MTTTWTDAQETKMRELTQLLKEAVSAHTKRVVQTQLHKLLQTKMAWKAEQNQTAEKLHQEATDSPLTTPEEHTPMTATLSSTMIHKLTEKAYVALSIADRKSGPERTKYILQARDYFTAAGWHNKAAWCEIQLDPSK